MFVRQCVQEGGSCLLVALALVNGPVHQPIPQFRHDPRTFLGERERIAAHVPAIGQGIDVAGYVAVGRIGVLRQGRARRDLFQRFHLPLARSRHILVPVLDRQIIPRPQGRREVIALFDALGG